MRTLLPKRCPTGTVMVVVLVVMVLAAMVAAGLMYAVRADSAAAGAADDGEQARLAAMTGVSRALEVLKQYSGRPDVWTDNEQLFRNQFVVDDGTRRWYFTLYSPNPADSTQVRYGIDDEAGRLNLNTVTEEQLLAVADRFEEMDEEHVDCLLDYRDTDDDVRPRGAEQTTYDRLDPPYQIRNQPLIWTVDELLLVHGFNARLVYGEDANLNGLLDPNERDGDDSFPPDDRNDVLNRGLRGLFTAVTYEPNVASDGTPRININGTAGDLNRLRNVQGLSRETVSFIQQYRRAGQVFKHPADLLNMEYEVEVEVVVRDENGRRVRQRRKETISSGVAGRELPVVLDRLTTRPANRRTPIRGLVNVNTASADVLSLVPGIDATLASDIVSKRAEALADEEYNAASDGAAAPATFAWLYTSGLTDAETFKKIAPYLTARSYQYRVYCVGFGKPDGRFCVLEAVIDLAQETPRLAYLRDITRLGLPFALDAEEKELGN